MGINQKKQNAKHPQSCNKSMLQVSWGQDWQLMAPPAFNHQDCPSAPTHGLDGRGQGHGLRSSPRWSSGPWGISYDPGLWDHPPPSPLQSLRVPLGRGGTHLSLHVHPSPLGLLGRHRGCRGRLSVDSSPPLWKPPQAQLFGGCGVGVRLSHTHALRLTRFSIGGTGGRLGT